MIADSIQVDAGKSQDSIKILRELDQMLIRRAEAIEAELREISQVRKRIESRLPPSRTASPKARHSECPWGKPGANDLVP